MAGLAIDRTMPRIIDAKTHSIIDYVHAGANITAGIVFLWHDRRAAKAAFALGAGILANALMTDYPRGVFRLYSFKKHGYIDYAGAAASGALPRILRIKHRPATAFFSLQSSAEGIIAGLTDYQDTTGAEHGRRGLWQRRAA
jgi:hypothetical protein